MARACALKLDEHMSSTSRIALFAALTLAACGSSSDSSDGSDTHPTSGVDAGATGPTSDGSTIVTSDASSAEDGATTSHDSGSTTSNDASASGDAAGNGATPTLPSSTGACPTFANGTVTFSPAGIAARSAQVYMSSAAATMHGPLIIYWYATGSSTAEVEYSLNTTLATIEATGGIVVAPQADPNAGEFEWYIVNGSSKLDDFLVADEIVACAAQTTQIDTTHIHSMGMSAGALQTTAMSFLRSDYLASVVTYSGGMPPGFTPSNENPANKFAALIFDGGSTDDVFGVDFQMASQTYYTTLTGEGHFAAICDHGMGHAIPTAAAPSVALFFQANGFGVYPSPYANGLPASFPSYCML
jgi:poly(3-hydroxybutyrate) depolymerase